jgi:aromatic ring-opening dioxygenase catalytic subunit (LigB family)
MASDGVLRREALEALGLGALGLVAAAAFPAALGAGCARAGGTEAQPPSPTPTPESASMTTDPAPTAARTPAVFLPHGGGPWPFIDERIFGAPGMWAQMDAYMRALGMVPPTQPRAVLVVSAHWEARVPTLMTARNPPMLYDYYGFPPEAYEVQWPAPGAPEVAEEARELLEDAGISSAIDATRGFDHGTFVPLALAYPEANVPTTQVSLQAGLDPATHLAIGRALAPLRDRGVFIVGSGMSYHNLRQLMRGDPSEVADDSRAFDDWLAETMSLEPSARETRLIEWERAPRARASHPREEHLLPLMVVAGAAAEDPATLPYRDVVMGAHVAAVHLG